MEPLPVTIPHSYDAYVYAALFLISHIDRIGGLKGLWSRIWNGKKTAVISPAVNQLTESTK